MLALDGGYLVVCDNTPDVLRVPASLSREEPDLAVVRDPSARRGYEDIAYDRRQQRFYLLLEALAHPDGGYRAAVREYDRNFAFLASAWLNHPFRRPNKGMEGLSWVDRDGESVLLGLAESPARDRRRPHHRRGLLIAFRRGRRNWKPIGTVALPDLDFADYSGLSVSGERIAVVSQESAALWVGQLDARTWRVSLGSVYRFPTDARGGILYGNVEGVSWLSDRELVAVSDKAKPGQPRRVRSKEQSIHRFALPVPVPAARRPTPAATGSLA